MKLAFGRFTFDSETRELLDDSRRVRLSPKAFDVLRILLERRPKVVGKHELQDLVWGADSDVGDANLSVVVAEIRQALGDEPRDPAFIRTVHRVGYAFSGHSQDISVPAARAERSSYCRCWINWAGRTIPLGEGENVIGRDPRCAVWIDASGVSRRHARIIVTADQAVLEDLGSSNGTYVRGREVSAAARLADGDAIEVGAATLMFRWWSEDRPPQTERLRGPRRAKDARS